MVDVAAGDAEGEFLRSILENFYACGTSDAFLVMSADGIIRGWPASAESLLGYSAQEMIGQPIGRIYTPQDLARRLDAFELEVARKDGYSEDDRWHVRKDGSALWVTGTLSALRDGEGVLRGYVKLLRDRTDLRTRMDRLSNAVQALELAARERQQFIDTLGHELRNPLGPLSLAVELLQGEVPPTAAAHALQVINRQVDALKLFANDLVELARGTTAGLTMAPQRIHLQALVQGAVTDMRDACAQKGVLLDSAFQAVPTYVDADPHRLLQVLLNLLGNALKYTPPGGKIFVKMSEEVDEAVIRVEDDGMGISPEMLPRIFEFFSRDPRAMELAPEGLGIGLALVRKIVEAHQGTVSARSSGPGTGSQFTVHLPLPPGDMS